MRLKDKTPERLNRPLNGIAPPWPQPYLDGCLSHSLSGGDSVLHGQGT
jgi:hypothetical protein